MSTAVVRQRIKKCHIIIVQAIFSFCLPKQHSEAEKSIYVCSIHFHPHPVYFSEFETLPIGIVQCYYWFFQPQNRIQCALYIKDTRENSFWHSAALMQPTLMRVLSTTIAQFESNRIKLFTFSNCLRL